MDSVTSPISPVGTTDKLVFEFYRCAADDDWQSFRVRALSRLSQVLGLESAVWWSRGRRGGDGELTQIPNAVVTLDELRRLAPREFTQPVLSVMPERPTDWLLHYPHLDGRLVSTLLLQFNGEARLPDRETLQRLCMHMVEASGIALGTYIRRDELLNAMGRASRGSGALVDSSGTIYVASNEFYQLLSETGGRPDALPFVLPEAVLDGRERSLIAGPLHFRVARVGQLYILHARKPLPLDALSPREQEIALALGNGKTFKSVARQYGIAVSTVANHASRIYRKLAIYRREDLVTLLRTPGAASNSAPRPRSSAGNGRH